MSEPVPPAPPRPHRLPGDPDRAAMVERMIRVDHAGEHGAVRIYDGQMAVLKRGPAARAVRHMAAQEKRHLESFDKLLIERRVRPTLLSPIWDVAGFALGAASALMGPKAAMACTVAVEEVIEEHYRRQAEALGGEDPALKDTIEEFRADEMSHSATALDYGAKDAPLYDALSSAVKTGARLAIWLSTRF
jgi:ubiquinone biosynthesis monooxygenase Coq7